MPHRKVGLRKLFPSSSTSTRSQKAATLRPGNNRTFSLPKCGTHSNRSANLTEIVIRCSLEIAALSQLLRETEERHERFETTHAKHHWSDWSAAYLNARLANTG